MLIDQAFLDGLSAQARAAGRLRKVFDLGAPEDGCQRVLNAIEPGSVIAVHRHRETAELMVALRGRLVVDLFDDGGAPAGSFELTPGGVAPAVSVPAGIWHTVRSLESGSVLLAVKEGPWAPLGEEDVK